jgi:hypothetical protein
VPSTRGSGEVIGSETRVGLWTDFAAPVTSYGPSRPGTTPSPSRLRCVSPERASCRAVESSCTSNATLGPRWVRVTTVEHGHGRSLAVAHGPEEPQVAGPSAQAAGPMQAGDSDCGPEGRCWNIGALGLRSRILRHNTLVILVRTFGSKSDATGHVSGLSGSWRPASDTTRIRRRVAMTVLTRAFTTR